MFLESVELGKTNLYGKVHGDDQREGGNKPLCDVWKKFEVVQTKGIV